MSNTVEQIMALLGGPAVLLPIPRNRKGPQFSGWQRTTLASMEDPAYRARLASGGNIGVLLGQASKGLCTVDLDGQEEATLFLDINPRLSGTLQTARVRGENVWIRIRGEFPDAGKIKDRATGRDIGEWRANGNQTVIYGAAIDATKGETQPTAYRILVYAPPLDIEFCDIQWPIDWLLPWMRDGEAKSRPVSVPVPGMIIIPSGEISILDCAETVFPMLAKTHRMFTRGGAVVEVVDNLSGFGRSLALELVHPSGFRSRLESYGRLMAWRTGKNGNSVLKPSTLPEDMARALLASEPARDRLPSIAAMTGCPVAIEDSDGNLQILARGYHPDLGGLLVTAGTATPRVEIGEAIKAIGDLVSEFDFQTPSDRSRALAAFIAPALSLGNFIKGRVPADVAEADQSQAGKGYRQKVTAAIYNESPRVVAQRDGGVGSLDESFSQALIGGRPFIQLDNLRGALNSMFLEAFFTADSIGARVPHRGEVPVDPRRFFIFATSNGIEATRDLANRSSIVRIRKRERYQFRIYPEGDLLEFVRARQPYYLGCVFSVIAEWLALGKPRTNETRHDFREWAQVLDWIVQRLFESASLLDGHIAAQERVSNPALVFLRALCLAAEQDLKLGVALTASGLSELADAHGITILGIRPGNEERAAKQVGIHLARLFKDGDLINVDGFTVLRGERLEERTDGKGVFPMKTYEIALS